MNAKVIALAIAFFTLIMASETADAPIFKVEHKNGTISNARLDTSLNANDILIVNKKTIKLELADTENKREVGLSFRESISSDEGMLFIFGNEGKPGFWMKDMRFPVDIIWLRLATSTAETEEKKFEVEFLKENVAPDTFPQIYYSDVPVSHVVEIKGGEAKRRNIKIGDNLYWISSK